MTEMRQALRERYLAPLEGKKELFIGIELEFPIVNQSGGPTDVMISKALLTHLSQQGYQVLQRDQEGQVVAVREEETADTLLFECSYNTLEFALGKVSQLGETETRFHRHLNLVREFLNQHGHDLAGEGIHPAWAINDNRPVKLPRYQMLSAYLALGKNQSTCHDFVDYGAFICGSQVQLDVTPRTYLLALNAFNQIEAAKAYLFSNSAFDGAAWDTRIARDIFWEDSMHGLVPENIGVYPKDFQTEEEFLTYLEETALFTAHRGEETYYFEPLRVKDYLDSAQVSAYDLSGQRQLFTPSLEDLATHRSYHYQVLTPRGTVEIRSVCTQRLAETFAPAAFHLGLLVSLGKWQSYLADSFFFERYGRDYPALRRQFSKKKLTIEEKNDVRLFSENLLEIAREGLVGREFGEENFLKPLFEKIKPED